MESLIHWPLGDVVVTSKSHDDVIKWKHFPRNWPFVRGIHWAPVNSLHKGHWRGALIFSLICVWINDWVNNHEAGDLRRYRAHCDVIVMSMLQTKFTNACEIVLRWMQQNTFVDKSLFVQEMAWCHLKPAYWPFVRRILCWKRPRKCFQVTTSSQHHFFPNDYINISYGFAENKF